MSDLHETRLRAVIYVVDLEPGIHSYAFVEGVGECREQFMRLVNDLEDRDIDVVVTARASYLFVDTAPMWVEKFIATVKQRGILIADTTTYRQYDLRVPEDETAFRAESVG